MDAINARLSERRSQETPLAAQDVQDEPSSGAVRPRSKGTWTTAWHVPISPLGVALSVVVAFGAVLGILMSLFLGELRGMEERLRQDMAATKQELRQDMAWMKQELRQDMALMEQGLRQDMALMEQGLRQDMASMEHRLRQDMASMGTGVARGSHTSAR